MELSTQELFDDALRHYEEGRLAEAEQLFQKILALDCAHVDALNYLGVIAYRQDRFDEAAAFYRRILAVAPDHAEVHNFLGSTLYKLGRIDEAAAACGRAVAISPDFAEAHYNQGFFLVRQGRHDEASACYARAIAIRPDYADAHYSKASCHLLRGDFGNGWGEYEWRWRTGEIKPHGFAGPLWDGKALHGKTLLLHCEQGMGDNIQFIRYAALIEKSGGRVLLACPSPLMRLFRGTDGIDEIFEITADGFKPPAYDWQAPLLSLPGIMGTTLENIPSGGAYLNSEPALTAVWRDRLAAYPGFKVGVVWRGNPTHRNDRNRSMSPGQFSEFIGLEGLAVISLQKDATPDEINALGLTGAFYNAGPQLEDFADTAALIANLDLVITVDTSVCHLAGAIGAPVWTLIPFASDWRWLRGREDSSWYPSMRLFRQPEAGDWQSVAARVREALASIIAKQII
jgi:tetratricopeptide (TPR) repeat protein